MVRRNESCRLLPCCAAVLFVVSGCALSRATECHRSRDVSLKGSLGASIAHASADVELKRRLTSEYDGILESYDMLCMNQRHMTGDEYRCEVMRHARWTRAFGDHLSNIKHCGKDRSCCRRSTKAWSARRSQLEAISCRALSATVEKRAPAATPVGAVLPTSGSPHGSGFVSGLGLFAYPGGYGVDMAVGYALDSSHELSITVISGTYTSPKDQIDLPILAIRPRYTYYFRAERDTKPYVRGSLVYFRREDAPVGRDRISIEAIGPLVEGGVVFDFVRWFGLYVEALAGYPFTITPNTSGTPILGLGLGAHIRILD
jgi:hypothetical protein